MIIGLTGFAQTGKDTTGAFIVEESSSYDFPYQRRAFADPLKEGARFLGWNGQKDFSFWGRPFLQRFGDALKTEFGEDFFAKLLLKENTYPNIVVTDVRFIVEASLLQEAGGIIVRIHRPGYGPINQHRSETELADIIPDFEIFNDGTLEDLRLKARKLLTEI